MKKYLIRLLFQRQVSFLLLGLLFYSFQGIAQCEIEAWAVPNPTCTGDTVQLHSAGVCGIKLMQKFNSGSLTGGFSSNTSPVFNNPCGPGLDLTPHLWFGSASAGPRYLTTPVISLTNSGCQVCFEMKYASQGNSSPCEGPDANNEGVYLQYSLNGGTTWTDIQYWNPNGGNDSLLTHWNKYCVGIPSAAISSATQFRWIQKAAVTSTEAHWGLDNIRINCNTGISISWSHGPTGFTPPPISLLNTTTFLATIHEVPGIAQASDSVKVNVKPRPTPDFTVTTPVCKNAPSTITYIGSGSSLATYNWDFNNGNILSGSGQGPYQISWNQTGTYKIKLQVVENYCPSYLFQKEILVAPLISFYLSGQSGCVPFPLSITDNSLPSGSNYFWDFGDGFTSTLQNPSHTYTNAGIYDMSAIIMTPSGCSDTFYIPNLIKVFPKPIMKATANPNPASIQQPSVSFHDKSIHATQWSWDFGDPGSSDNSSNQQNPKHTYNQPGIYTVKLIATTEHGCSDTTLIIIKIVDDRIEIPNVFTPNNDGFNDKFEIKNLENLIECQLVIFNRWGQKVFETNRYQNNWDATGIPDGVYYFIISCESIAGSFRKSGSISILR